MRHWLGDFWGISEGIFEPKIQYPVKIAIKFEEKVKAFSNLQDLKDYVVAGIVQKLEFVFLINKKKTKKEKHIWFYWNYAMKSLCE